MSSREDEAPGRFSSEVRKEYGARLLGLYAFVAFVGRVERQRRPDTTWCAPAGVGSALRSTQPTSDADARLGGRVATSAEIS